MQRNRSAHTACILPNRRDIVNSRKLFSNKNRQWFFHSDRLFSLLPLKNPLRKHTSFGKSLAAWRNLAATPIFLFLFHSSKCNAFFGLDYVSPNKKKAVQKKLTLNFLRRRVRFLAINKDICCQMRLLTVRCTTIKSKSQSNTTINEFVRD